MIHISRILCPIDFSEFSRDALDHAAALAHWYHAELTVMHVFAIPAVPLPIAGLPEETIVSPPPIDRSAIADDVRRFALPAINSAVTWDVFVALGNPAAEIARQTEQMGVNLLVLGTHGRTGFARLVLGSVTERLLRIATAPVMTVPPPVKRLESVRYRAILCPLDFSDESMQALRYALSLAQEANSRIILLHVLEGFVDEPDFKEFRDLKVLDYHQHLEARATERLAQSIPDEARTWARPSHRVAKGKPYRQILRIAGEDNIDLIVMGVRGRGALDKLFFGSTTEQVIRRANCPVLTIRKHTAETANITSQ
jgi:nucleotide-binding universal stress UspA family protein